MTKLPEAEFSQLLTDAKEIAEAAALAGGEVLMKWLGKASVTEKNAGDYVTQADFESQKTIQALIAKTFPEHDFLGEEDLETSNDSNTSDFCWIVDPLDGTTNYIHQMQSFSVSIGLRYRDEMVVGCVYDPMLKEMYIAKRGGGATLNNQPIRVSGCKDVDRSMIVCSFPRGVQRGAEDFVRFENLICDTRASVRRLGSAALNLCYIACGRLDGYWATALSVWDVAGGAIILEEAGGGLYSIVPGQPFDIENPKLLATATPELFESLKPHMCFET